MSQIILSNEPRDYQSLYRAHVNERLANPGERKRFLYSSPTSTGKSVMELLSLIDHNDMVLLTPRLAIVADMLVKSGAASKEEIDSWSDEKLAEVALLNYRITTPVRFRNMLAKGTLPIPRPRKLMIDEAHHSEAETIKEIVMYLGDVLVVGLTASPFRGTISGTADFMKWWEDEITYVLDIPEAAKRKLIAVPTVKLWPLLDDDMLEVVNGEFKIEQVGKAMMDVATEVAYKCCAMMRPTDHLVTHICSTCARETFIIDEAGRVINCPECNSNENTKWDMATIFSMPNMDSVLRMVQSLRTLGIPAVAITQETPRPERVVAFRQCERGEVAIVQIDVVSEGVDLQIRRVIDCRATKSAVKWIQQIGRIRYAEYTEYICTNRNLERFGNLYMGVIPAGKIAEAQQMFGKPSARAITRVTGIETLGRFKPTEVPFADGTTGTLYHLVASEGFRTWEYAIVIHPAYVEPIFAKRTNTKDEKTRKMIWGRWEAIPGVDNLSGYGASQLYDLSEKQKAWWKTAAEASGLDKLHAPNRRSFQALPVIRDVGVPQEWRDGGFITRRAFR